MISSLRCLIFMLQSGLVPCIAINMETKQIKNTHAAVLQAIRDKRLKDAFSLLLPMLRELHDGDLLDMHYNLELTYRSILKYAAQGVDDPQRAVVYSHLVVGVYALADQAGERLLAKFSGEMAYDLKRDLQANPAPSLGDEMEALFAILDEGRLKALASPGMAYPPEYTVVIARIFKLVWLTDKWDDVDLAALKQLFASQALPWHLKSLVCSALLLSLIRTWNLTLVLELFNIVGHDDYRVRMRAMVDLMLVLYRYDSRLDLFPEIPARLKILRDDPVTAQQIQALMVQLIRTRETEKISQKLQDEIIPEVMKMQSVIRQKLDLDNLVSDKGDDKNPEWGEMFADSPQLLNKLEEISKWQMEGADVFLNTFQMLKHFPFFSQFENWFLPFYIDNPLVQQAIADSGDVLRHSALFDNIGNSTFLCNSDKYSLFLGIPHMPSMQREMLGQMFKAEMEQLNEISNDELLINPGKRDLSVSNQYIQDLYRFFKVHPQRHQFHDVFALKMDFYKKGFFNHLFPEPEPARQLGEYLFGKGYHAEVLEIFGPLSAQDHENVELIQKIAFCHQQLGQVQQALDCFLKADLLRPGNLWTLKKIAKCYVQLRMFNKALECYHEIVKIDEDNLQVHAAIGHCLLEEGRFEEALKHFFRVEYLDPSNTKVWRPIAWCSFVLGKFEQSEKYYHKLMMLQRNANDMMGLGHVYLCSGRIKEGMASYCDSAREMAGGYAAFVQAFEQDRVYLLRLGVSDGDVPVYLDQIKYQLEE